MNPNEKPDRYANWKELITKQEKSGLSQTEFCKQHNLVLSKFVYYRSVIKSKNCVETNKKLFSAIKIQDIKDTETSVLSETKIVLPNGIQCFIQNAANMLPVKRLIEILLSC